LKREVYIGITKGKVEGGVEERSLQEEAKKE
jgi:hypothetical protein